MNRKKIFELKKDIWKKEEKISRLWSQLDSLKIKHYPYAPPEKIRLSLHERLFKNIEELKSMKDILKKIRGW